MCFTCKHLSSTALPSRFSLCSWIQATSTQQFTAFSSRCSATQHIPARPRRARLHPGCSVKNRKGNTCLQWQGDGAETPQYTRPRLYLGPEPFPAPPRSKEQEHTWLRSMSLPAGLTPRGAAARGMLSPLGTNPPRSQGQQHAEDGEEMRRVQGSHAQLTLLIKHDFRPHKFSFKGTSARSVQRSLPPAINPPAHLKRH